MGERVKTHNRQVEKKERWKSLFKKGGYGLDIDISPSIISVYSDFSLWIF